MMSAAISTPAAAETSVPREFLLAGHRLVLDSGGVAVIAWPDSAALSHELATLYALVAPVVRYTGGALIGDLSLGDNLTLESALRGGGSSRLLRPEMDALFARLNCPIDWPGVAVTLPEFASRLAKMQIRVGRALLADPDVLLVDASDWDEQTIPSRQFSQSFCLQYPWRTLVWACLDEGNAARLRQSLQETAS